MYLTLTTLLHNKLFFPGYDTLHRHFPTYAISRYAITDVHKFYILS